LPAAAFKSGTDNLAGDADDRIIYNIATGSLFYDPDGKGGQAAVLFAKLRASTLLSASDFI
jgi:serralysin